MWEQGAALPSGAGELVTAWETVPPDSGSCNTQLVPKVTLWPQTEAGRKSDPAPSDKSSYSRKYVDFLETSVLLSLGGRPKDASGRTLCT